MIMVIVISWHVPLECSRLHDASPVRFVLCSPQGGKESKVWVARSAFICPWPGGTDAFNRTLPVFRWVEDCKYVGLWSGPRLVWTLQHVRNNRRNLLARSVEAKFSNAPNPENRTANYELPSQPKVIAKFQTGFAVHMCYHTVAAFRI